MRRRILLLASAVSFLSCLATSVLWVRSYFVSDVLVRNRPLPPGRYELPHEVPGVIGEEMREVAATRGKILMLRANVTSRNGTPRSTLLPWRHFAEFPPLRTPEVEFYPTISRNGSSNRFLGVHWAQWSTTSPSRRVIPTTTNFEVGVLPLWWPFLLAAALGLLCGRTALRPSRRTRAGRCRQCNYNLTGNTSGVCPECGSTVASVRTAQL